MLFPPSLVSPSTTIMVVISSGIFDAKALDNAEEEEEEEEEEEDDFMVGSVACVRVRLISCSRVSRVCTNDHTKDTHSCCWLCIGSMETWWVGRRI